MRSPVVKGEHGRLMLFLQRKAREIFGFSILDSCERQRQAAASYLLRFTRNKFATTVHDIALPPFIGQFMIGIFELL